MIHSAATGIPPGGTTVTATPGEFLFAGEQFDSDLNLYYNRARYLNASTGRFWSMDSYEGDRESPSSLHKYLYVGGDPVNSLDRSGKFTLGDITAALGELMSLAARTAVIARNVKWQAVYDRTEVFSGPNANGSTVVTFPKEGISTKNMLVAIPRVSYALSQVATQLEELEQASGLDQIVIQESDAIVP